MHGQEALQILREFVADVMVAHDNSYSKAMAALEDDWFDLALTFQRAYAFVERADS